MPLSEEEQRVLDEMERQFRTSEPKVTRSAQRPVAPSREPKPILAGVAMVIAGLVVLLAGFTRHPVIGFAGFALMLGGAVALRRPVAELVAAALDRVLEARGMPRSAPPPRRRRTD